MFVIPRQVCREISGAMQREWCVRNRTGSYASASITGALTRRQHGLLVAVLAGTRTVMLAKLDEELEVEGRVYKLGTNEYLTSVISPDGFLFLQQVTYDGVVAEFSYEAGRFQLTKTLWMDDSTATTYIRYALAPHSAPARLTLIPLCDYRSIETLTRGNEGWHFGVETLPHGICITAHPDAHPFCLLSEPPAVFTPLDLWYWRFQLRADDNLGLDLHVPGLLRAELEPGKSFTLIATAEPADSVELDGDTALQKAHARELPPSVPASDEFTPVWFTT
jgi:predicted glycogen debranching enzyme